MTMQDVQKIIVLDYGSQYNQLISRRAQSLAARVAARPAPARV